MRPYYQDDLVTLYHGDCVEVLATLPPAADLVFTSPPYNLGNTTGGGFPDRFVHYRKSSGLAGRGGGGNFAARFLALCPRSRYVNNTLEIRMREMTLFEKEAIRVALSAMFEPGKWLDVSCIRYCCELAGVQPPHRTMTALSALHCVSWSKMTHEMRQATAQEIMGLFDHPGFDLPTLHESFLPSAPAQPKVQGGFLSRLLPKGITS